MVRSIVLHSVPRVSSYQLGQTPSDLYRARSAGSVRLAEIVSSVGDRERSVRFDGGTNPVPLAFGRFFEVCDHVLRRIRGLVLLEEREVSLPDALDSRYRGDSLVVAGRRLRRVGGAHTPHISLVPVS